MPDVIPVVMWVTTKATASLRPWEQRLNCYAYKNTRLVPLSLLPLPRYRRHGLPLGIPTRLEEMSGNGGGRNHLGDTSHFSQLGDNQTPGLSYQTAGTSCERFNWSPRQCPLLFCSDSAFAMSCSQSRHTLELIPKQTVLSSYAGFLSDRCLWQKGRWKPSGCCICSPRKSTGPRAKVSRPQNQGRHSYHQFKISNPSINTTSSSEGHLWQVSDLTVLLALAFILSRLGTLRAF